MRSNFDFDGAHPNLHTQITQQDTQITRPGVAPRHNVSVPAGARGSRPMPLTRVVGYRQHVLLRHVGGLAAAGGLVLVLKLDEVVALPPGRRRRVYDGLV